MCPTCSPAASHKLVDFLHGQQLCKTSSATLTCVVCKEDKLRSEYGNSILMNRGKNDHKHQRCNACSVCPACPQDRKSRWLTDFKSAAERCKDCEGVACAACGKFMTTLKAKAGTDLVIPKDGPILTRLIESLMLRFREDCNRYVIPQPQKALILVCGLQVCRWLCKRRTLQ